MSISPSHWMTVFKQQHQLENLINYNQYTQNFGLALSQEDALALIRNKQEYLRKEERVEFGEDILQKLIFAFCASPYIYQTNYLETIDSLQCMFYYCKNESLDELSDDELIEFMANEFNGSCQGSLDYLEETVLTAYCKAARFGQDYDFFKKER